MRTQWRVSAFTIVGLDYSALDLVARIRGIELSTEILDKIQALENEELMALAKKEADPGG